MSQALVSGNNTPVPSQLSTNHIMISSPYPESLSPLYQKLKLLLPDVQILMVRHIILISIYDIRKAHSTMRKLEQIVKDNFFNMGFYNNDFYHELVSQINYDPSVQCNTKVVLGFYRSILILHSLSKTEFQDLLVELYKFGEVNHYLTVYEKDNIHISLISYFDIRSSNRARSWLDSIQVVINTTFFDYNPTLEQERFESKLRIEKGRLLSTFHHNYPITPSSSDHTLRSNSYYVNMHSNQNNTQTNWKKEDTDRIIYGIEKSTTFMIRNIPNKYTQSMLLDVLNTTHKGEFDFLYLRIDFENRCNVGYAFINFIDKNAILKFIEMYLGKRWPHFNSVKVCDLALAKIQGIEALVKHFQNSKVLEHDPSYRPLLFYTHGLLKGQPINFPTPNSDDVNFK